MADRPDKREAGAKALAQYEAEAQALRARTARLRELRLAQEAANQSVAPAPAAKRAPPKTKSKKKSGKSNETSETLSEWLKTQQNQGRRS